MTRHILSIHETQSMDISIVADTKEQAAERCFATLLTANEMIDDAVDSFTERFETEISGFRIVGRSKGTMECVGHKEVSDTTTVTGTLTFQSEKDAREITRRFPAFQADTGWAYTDLVDHAIELVSLPDIGGYSWMQISENINEALNREGD